MTYETIICANHEDFRRHLKDAAKSGWKLHSFQFQSSSSGATYVMILEKEGEKPVQAGNFRFVQKEPQ